MIRKTSLGALALALLTGGLGCDTAASKGTDTGNGFSIGLSAAQADGPYVALDAQGTVFEVQQARANVASITLFLPGGLDCDAIEAHPQATCNAARYTIEGPFDVDLVTRTADPPIEAPIPAGTYKRVDVRFDVGAGMGRTLFGSGVYDDQGTDAPFDFALGFGASVKFESDGGVVIEPEHDLLALLDVATWFSAQPITDCVANGELDVNGGRVQVANGRGRCAALETGVVDSLKASGRLAR